VYGEGFSCNNHKVLDGIRGFWMSLVIIMDKGVSSALVGETIEDGSELTSVSTSAFLPFEKGREGCT